MVGRGITLVIHIVTLLPLFLFVLSIHLSFLSHRPLPTLALSFYDATTDLSTSPLQTCAGGGNSRKEMTLFITRSRGNASSSVLATTSNTH
mmetsp:Transcript_22290/g.31859  ORF Transcript_22290/g.31859 Transcript_22290/m.31859 type:complete len:91 (-) Transcript_22290:318-590(-)